MKIHFLCPECEAPARLRLPAPPSWVCPACDHVIELGPAAGDVPACALCGNTELYKKKDFPHWLGLTILTVACLGFLAGHAFYLPWVAWSILLGFAAADAVLYLVVGDAVVCYRCHAHYRGVRPNAEHKPFELTVHERYRQERLRREQLEG